METQNARINLHEKNIFGTFERIRIGGSKNSGVIRSYKRRFWMLSIYSTLSMLCGSVFTQYTVMANVNMCFYGVSPQAIDWTTLIFMVVYIVLVCPVSWLIGKVGLRTTVIMGSVCNTLSYAIQFASHSPDRFDVVLVTSFFGSLSNLFILGIPPPLSATWFPSNEVSRACSVGVFGNQLGVAVGFVVSPLMISDDCGNKDLIAEGKRNVSILFTTANAIVLLLLIFTFEEEPPNPPSIAQSEKMDIEESFIRSAVAMVKSVNFVLVFIMYGLVIGGYFAVVTLLDDLILLYFPDAEEDVGWMGLLVIVIGLLGCVIAGCILDHTHTFKETSIGISVLCFIFYIIFSCVLVVNKLWLQFITIGILGLFLTSSLPVGFEYGIEVTYPESEITSANLLNSATMIFGIIITEIASFILEYVGPAYANGAIAASFLLAAIVGCFITKNYKRSQKNEDFVTTKL